MEPARASPAAMAESAKEANQVFTAHPGNSIAATLLPRFGGVGKDRKNCKLLMSARRTCVRQHFEGLQPLSPIFWGGVLFLNRSKGHLRVIWKLLHRFLKQRRVAGGAKGGEETGGTAPVFFEVRLKLFGLQLQRLI